MMEKSMKSCWSVKWNPIMMKAERKIVDFV